MNPFYCEGPAHDDTYPAPILGYADHPEHVHAVCNVCGRAAREAQAKDNTISLRQYLAISVAAARAKLEAGEIPHEAPPLTELDPPPPPPKIGPLATRQQR
jgi:hypothetical protein